MHRCRRYTLVFGALFFLVVGVVLGGALSAVESASEIAAVAVSPRTPPAMSPGTYQALEAEVARGVLREALVLDTTTGEFWLWTQRGDVAHWQKRNPPIPR